MVLAASTVAGRCTGIDYALAAYTLARFRRRRAGSPSNTTIRREDFLKADISDATHIFCYLFPPVMQDLHLKFQKELKPGTRVVSCDFPIVGKEPKATIPFKKQKLFFNKLGTTLYVYEY